jgi:penicillin-binding protein 1A
MPAYIANSLGSMETTLYKVVSAYAMFANGGERVEPTLVDRIQDRYGKTIYKHDPRLCPECSDPNIPEGLPPLILSKRERVMNAITAYQLTSMMQGVVDRGTAAQYIDLPVPVAGKTGTTNEARDVWFTGFTSNMSAGCYIGYDNPEPLGKGAFGGSMCAPVFQEFMSEAIKTYGGGAFRVPSGGQFIKIDRFTGARLPDTATGDNVVAEYFREGEEPVFGVTMDGGFAMGADVPLLEEVQAALPKRVTNSSGGNAIVGGKASAGALSSGGLY